MERKYFTISIFITLVAIAFLGGYLLMPEHKLDQQTGTFLDRFNKEVEIGLTQDRISDVASLSDRRFISFVSPFTDSQKIVATDNSGNIIEINLATLNEKVIYTGLTSIVEALLSLTGDSIIYSLYDSGNNKKYTYLNFKKNERREISGDLKSVAFSADGDEIVYLINNGEDGEVLISKNGNIVKRVLKTRLGTGVLAWPSDKFISLISYDKDGYGDLFTLEENGSFNKIISYRKDLNVQWSPSAGKIIFSAKNDSGASRLFYKDPKNNDGLTDLGVNTSASKCVWAGEEEVVCGITSQDRFKDEFYKIKVADGSKTLALTPNINLLIKELVLSHSGDTLFVLNEIDNRLYTLKLQK